MNANSFYCKYVISMDDKKGNIIVKIIGIIMTRYQETEDEAVSFNCFSR